VALCDHYNRDERAAWMKQGTLAEWTGFTRATVNAALVALEEKHKLIKSETRRYADGRNASKVYRLNISVKEIDTALARVNEIDTDSVNGVDPDSVKEIDNKNQEHRTVNKEPKREKKVSAHEFDPATVTIPEAFDRELFHDFCTRRLEKGEPMTFLALKQFISKHKHRSPEELDEMFRSAIIAGWKDLYPRDGKKAQPAKPKALSQYTERGL
jgi:hypothetical protein